MASGWLRRVLGAPGAVTFRRFAPVVARAAGLAERMRGARDAELRAIASERAGGAFGPGRDVGGAELLAALREIAGRAVGITAFDEQLTGVCALVTGHAAELDTGEGKTLVGALSAAALALAGRRVHVLSVNDYLAQRDAEAMGPLFRSLGLDVAWIGQQTPHEARREAYRADIVYAPVSEVGFDLLRDRFTTAERERVEPVFDAAIVDEIDGVLVDEAMVPLVLAGADDEALDDRILAAERVERLQDGRDFEIDSDHTTAALTDAGLDRLERELGGINLYDEQNIQTLTVLNLALHARVLLERDVDYLVQDGAIRLISASRGRIAQSQRWPDGLQAAVEAKERLAASAAGVVLDTVTVQDLVRRYRSVAGMSGTVVGVAEELLEFFELRSGRVERHRPLIRIDEPCRVLPTGEDVAAAVVAETAAWHASGAPVLVGTQSVAESEAIAVLLGDAGVTARVLNARNDAEEAGIVARAGEYGAVTISTQMSGRGTDIRLGGADESDRGRVVAAGGLVVIATGRYPTARLDAQLRGRSGRQGDPGRSIGFAALDSDLVRAGAADFRLAQIERMGDEMPDDRRRRIVDEAQRSAEGVRRDRHRATWEYSRAIERERASVMRLREELMGTDAAVTAVGERAPDELDRLGRGAALAETLRQVALFLLDDHWVMHLASLQEIRDGIHLRALAGLRPADEFHRIALREFAGFADGVFDELVAAASRLVAEDIGADIAGLGFRRPSTTWTYMVTDDPFGAPGDRAARQLGFLFRSKVLRIV